MTKKEEERQENCKNCLKNDCSQCRKATLINLLIITMTNTSIVIATLITCIKILKA